jgi:L-asparaginase/Glu-tRNA(Gln) amidotransferase subunit D
VVVFGLGGTIAMNAATPGSVVPSLSAEQLLTSVPGLPTPASPWTPWTSGDSRAPLCPSPTSPRSPP